MSERKINLEEIILDVYGCKNMDELRDYMGEYGSVAMIKDCMKEAIKKALELAAENVVIELLNHDRYCIRTDTSIEIEPNENSEEFNFGGLIKVDKQSILNTINQIE